MMPMKSNKLNLGSGKSYRPDCINVDLNPKFNPDILADMREVTFQKESFREVLLCDVLDHIPYADVQALLRKILKWLKPAGYLEIHTPNLDHLIYILRISEDKKIRHEALKWLYGSDGIGTTAYDTNHIRWAYNKKSLTTLLKGVGFKIVKASFDCNNFGLTVVAQK